MLQLISNPLTVKLIALTAFVSIIFSAGWKVASWRCDSIVSEIHKDAQEVVDEARRQAKKVEQLQDELNAAVIEAARLKQKKQEVVERVITNEVIKYVQTPVSAECGLDANGVRIVNLAAAGDLSRDTESAEGAAGAAEGVSAAVVVSTVTENYGACHETRNRLIALQSWVKGLSSD